MRSLRRFGCALLSVLIVLSLAIPFALAADEVYLTWDEYVEANNVTSWNYNDQAVVIAEVANHAVELYEAGEREEAYEYAKATYWGYYEVSGFERNTMNYISGSRVSEVELAFTTLRKSIKKDQGAEAARAAADALIDLLVTDGAILSPEGAIFTNVAESQDEAEADAGAAADFELGYFLTWDEYKEAYGITSWNYNDQAIAIAGVAYHAIDLYEAGELEEAYEYAKATYWGYYEVSGFERNTMNYISGSRVSEVELAFTTLRKSIKKDLGVDAARQAADDLVELLVTDGAILSPEGALNVTKSADTETGTEAAAEETTTEVKTGTSIGSSVAVFLGSFAIILREGLEAILIVGAIIAYLIKSGNKKGVLPVYIGSALGVVFSFIMAGILNWLLARSAEYHMSQEVIEGIAALTAVVVLFWVSNWMVSKSESAAWTQYIEGQVASSSSRGSAFALAFTAWLAVFREGAEVILFYQPMLAEDRPDMVWLGFGVGVAALVVVFLLIRFLSVKLPLKPFFMGTSILMAIMSISFLGAGIKELIEGAVFEEIEFIDLSWVSNSPKWLSWIPYNDTLDVLGIYPLVGTIVPQLILLAITVITFVMHLRRNKKIRLEAEQKAAE
ncbi:MAG: FTR1 family iron permease [Oscillospiraceae bacterium]|nr:FTR1 family iron permease [Oscillospiraceae bacterium]